MEDIRIYSVDGKLIYIAPITDNAERIANIQGNNQLKLVWYADKCDILPTLAYCDYGNERFYLKSTYRPDKQATHLYQYNVAFVKLDGLISNAILFRYVDVDGIVWQEPEFSLNANKATITELFIESLNKLPIIQKLGISFTTAFQDDDNVYQEYYNTKLNAFNFSGDKYADAFSQVANAFETEYWIEDTNDSSIKVLHFDLCDKGGKEIEMSDDYSEDGLISGGLSKVEISNSNEVPERIYVYGSERNITKKTVEKQVAGGVMNVSYAKKLRLNNIGEPYQDTTDAGVAITIHPQDSSIEIDGISNGFQEVYTNDEIYPKMDMVVSSVRSVKGANDMPIYYLKSPNLTADFMDSEIAESYPDSINPSRYGLLLDGTTLMITFTSGLLNGREFECAWYQGEVELGIIPTEEDDQQLPYGNYIPKEGDTFILWNLAMPQSRIEIAQNELLRDAKRHIDEIVESIHGCKCKTDEQFYAVHGEHYPITLGQRVKVTSDVFANTIFAEASLLSRVISFSYKLTKPYDISFELSEARRTGILERFNNELAEIKVQQEQVEQLSRSVSRRQWHDIQEMMGMIESMQTQMMVVGNEHDNFALNAELTYNNEEKKLSITTGYLQHAQYIDYGDNGAWKVQGVTIDLNEYNAEIPYYLYVVCPKDNNTASEIRLAEYTMTDTESSFAFLVGILSSEYEESRVFNRTSGLTITTGGTITTEQIQDENRQLIIDFSSNPPRIIARNGAEIIGNIKYLASDGEYKSLSDLGYIHDALKEGSTDIDGGLVLTNMLQLKNEQGNVIGGLNGVEESTNDVFLWAGGTLQQAIERVIPIVIGRDGTAQVGIMQVNKDNVIIKQYDENSNYIGYIMIDKDGIHVVNVTASEKGKLSYDERVLITANYSEEVANIKNALPSTNSYTNGFSYTDESRTKVYCEIDDLYTYRAEIISAENETYINFELPVVKFEYYDTTLQEWVVGSKVSNQKHIVEAVISNDETEDYVMRWDEPTSSEKDGVYKYSYKQKVYTDLPVGTKFYVSQLRVLLRNTAAYMGKVRVSVTWTASSNTKSRINRTIIAKNGIAHRPNQSDYFGYYTSVEGYTHFVAKANDVDIKEGNITVAEVI